MEGRRWVYRCSRCKQKSQVGMLRWITQRSVPWRMLCSKSVCAQGQIRRCKPLTGRLSAVVVKVVRSAVSSKQPNSSSTWGPIPTPARGLGQSPERPRRRSPRRHPCPAVAAQFCDQCPRHVQPVVGMRLSLLSRCVERRQLDICQLCGVLHQSLAGSNEPPHAGGAGPSLASQSSS
jgi:hypothetical protein